MEFGGDCVPTEYLDREELGPKLCQPLRVHSCDALHVLLCSVHKLMVDDVVRSIAQAIQCACWMQEAWHACMNSTLSG